MKTLVSLGLASAAVLFSGCVSAKYRRAPSDTPPATVLNLTAHPAAPTTGAATPLGAVLGSVIVFRGPGSWKRDAYWDEYALAIANHGATPLVIESASLADFRGDLATPGDNPWALEKQSRTRAEELNSQMKTAAVQLGTGAVAAGWAVGQAALAGAGSLAIFPVFVLGAVLNNLESRHGIETEFARRRLVLPATLAPGQVVEGSFFFRIAPGPQRLALRARAGAEAHDLVFDLKPLAGLHLKPATPVAPANASKSSSP